MQRMAAANGFSFGASGQIRPFNNFTGMLHRVSSEDGGVHMMVLAERGLNNYTVHVNDTFWRNNPLPGESEHQSSHLLWTMIYIGHNCIGHNYIRHN